MKAIFFSLGSRGDIEPLFSLGEFLLKEKWEIVYVFPEQFKEIVQSDNSKFYGFTKEFIEVLLESEQSKNITSRSGSVFSRLKTLLSLAKKSIRINKEVTIKQKEIIDIEKPDFIFFNQKCVYPIVWGMQKQNKSVFVHPFPCFLHPVENHSIIGFSGGGNYGFLLNGLSYKFQSLILSIAVYFTTRKILNNDKSSRISPFRIKKYLQKKITSIYTVSPSLFKQPKSWDNNAKVVGFIERDKTVNWEPSKNLENFLKIYQGKKIIFITFGSISNPNPRKKTKVILKSLKRHRIPTIINTSWGGLIEIENCPDHILFVEDIPYEWIFPKVYGVIHHGGAGTTHSAVKYGCASLIIPHFIDQFFWSKTIVNNNLGPKGISIKKLKEDNFEKSLLNLIENPKFKINAEKFSFLLKDEFSIKKLIDNLINTN